MNVGNVFFDLVSVRSGMVIVLIDIVIVLCVVVRGWFGEPGVGFDMVSVLVVIIYNKMKGLPERGPFGQYV